METTKKKVAVIGALNVDMGARADSALNRGDSIPGTVRLSLGGVGWNIARNCALLGAQTDFYSLLGRDEQADAIGEQAARCGVNLAYCRWVERQNNRYLYVCDEHGDVAAAVNDMGLCQRMDTALAEAWLPALRGYDAAAVDANLPAQTLALLAREMDVPLVADCVSAAKAARLRPILSRLHTVKANRLEAEALTGLKRPLDCARALLEAGVRRAVITLGSEGILCAEGRQILAQPAAGGRVVDATGAGDSMTAALTVGLAGALPLEQCARLGVAAAGITIASAGSVTDRLRSLAERF